MTLLDLLEFVTLWVGVKVTLLVGLAYGVTLLMDEASAALRHAVWGVALTGILLGPLVGPVAPSWHLEPVSEWVASWTRGSADPGSAGSASARVAEAEGPIESRAREGVVEVGPEGAGTAIGGSGGGGVDWRRAVRWGGGLLLFVWAAGVGLFLVRLGDGVWRIARISGRADPVSEALREEIRAVSEHGRRVRVAFTSELEIPVNWGLWRPVVLLPEDAREWPRDRLRAVCRHEVAHVRRRDYAVHLVGRLARAFAWPNPAVWFGIRRLYLEQEEACDDEVIRSGIPAADYADHILALLRSWHGDVATVRGGLTLARGGVKGRIRRMLDEGRSRHPLGPGLLLTVIVLGGCVSLPVIGFQTGATEPSAHSDRLVWIEAEEGWLQRPIRAENGLSASGWSYLRVDEDRNSRDEPPRDGRITYEFDVDRADTYRIWGRARASDGGSDSFWIRVDGGEWIRWNGLVENEDWVWQPVHDSDGEDSPIVSFELDEGTHTLELAYREGETRLDRFVVSADTAFVPRGRGPLPPDHRPARIERRAEDGRVSAPMEIRTDSARGASYVIVPDGPGNDPPHGGSGMTEIEFEVPRSDVYVVWGLVRGPNENDNSFFVSLDGGEEFVWDVPGPKIEDTADTWTWDPISRRSEDGLVDPVRLELSEGTHRLRIRNREDGAALDRLIVTNEPVNLLRSEDSSAPLAEAGR